MNILLLGQLKPDVRVPEWLISKPLAIPYFDGLKITVTLDGLSDSDEADVSQAIAAFFQLGQEARMAASPYLYLNYKGMLDHVSADELVCCIDSEDNVWEHVHPTEIFVSRRHRRDKGIYICICAECDWELEHGLQIIYRDGNNLSRVSDQDGHLTHTDAYDLPENQDKIA